MTTKPQQSIDMENTKMNNMKYGLSRLGKSKQGGFSLPELAIVLMIAALIAAAAMVVVPRVLASVRAGKLIDEFNTAIPAIQTAYQNQTSFSRDRKSVV